MTKRVLLVGREPGTALTSAGQERARRSPAAAEAAPGAVLRREGFDARPTGDDGAMAELRRRPPDLVLLDLPLSPSDPDGLELCRRLRAAAPTVPILITSSAGAVADRVAGLEAGADDYLSKPFEAAELVARARALLRRARARRPSGDMRLADLALDVKGRAASRGERPLDLTPRELDLMRAFLERPEHVLPREHLLDVVWGEPADVEPNVVDVYVGYLRRKLEQGGEPRLIWTVRGVGYVLREG